MRLQYYPERRGAAVPMVTRPRPQTPRSPVGYCGFPFVVLESAMCRGFESQLEQLLIFFLFFAWFFLEWSIALGLLKCQAVFIVLVGTISHVWYELNVIFYYSPNPAPLWRRSLFFSVQY